MSLVGYSQIFSDKSQNFPFASSLHFYPFHTSVLCIDQRMSQMLIFNGRTVVAYLPARFCSRIVDTFIDTFSEIVE